ncbi:MAG: hypothetical protein GY758_29440 [Fuerstiella sp.]|nr:hypothetical protein [Fuerstiella sp.]
MSEAIVRYRAIGFPRRHAQSGAQEQFIFLRDGRTLDYYVGRLVNYLETTDIGNA